MDNPDEPTELSHNATVLLHGYSDKTKADGFYQATLGTSGVNTLMQGEYKLSVLGRSKDADTLLFQRSVLIYSPIYILRAITHHKMQ